MMDQQRPPNLRKITRCSLHAAPTERGQNPTEANVEWVPKSTQLSVEDELVKKHELPVRIIQTWNTE